MAIFSQPATGGLRKKYPFIIVYLFFKFIFMIIEYRNSKFALLFYSIKIQEQVFNAVRNELFMEFGHFPADKHAAAGKYFAYCGDELFNSIGRFIQNNNSIGFLKLHEFMFTPVFLFTEEACERDVFTMIS